MRSACADFSRGPAAAAVDAGAGEGGAASPDARRVVRRRRGHPDRRLPALSLDRRGGGRHHLAAHRRGRGRSRDRRPLRRRERARRQPPARQDGRQRAQRGRGLRRRRRPNTRPSCDGFKKEHDHDPRAACVSLVPRRAIAIAALAVAAATCAKLEKERPPQILIAGPHAVALGATITITVTTQDGSDSAYTLTSADTGVASVDGNGVVTGLAVGETSISVDRREHQGGRHARHRRRRARGHLADPLLRQVADVGARRPDRGSRSTTGTARAASRPTARAATARKVSSTTSAATAARPARSTSPRPSQSVIRCQTCHNAAADALSSVTFPSGETVDGLGGEARCMTCHQGRASGKDVDAADRRRGGRRATTRRRRDAPLHRTSTTTRRPRRCSRGAPRAATSTPGRSTTSASATSTAMTPASAATIRTRPRCASTSAPAATPASPTSAARTRSG